MVRQRFWLIVVTVALGLAVAAFFATRPKPRFAFLSTMELAKVEVRLEKTTGRPRRIEIYRTEDTFAALEKEGKAILAREGWTLSGHDDSPRWTEYHGATESIEFIDDEPTEYEVKPLGVLWTPLTGGSGSRRTVIYTSPASGWDRFRHQAGTVIDRLLGNF